MVSKVCFYTNKIYLSGGAERVICTLASEFMTRGIDTTIITQESTECGYPLHPDIKVLATKTDCKIPGVRLLKRCFQLRQMLKVIAPDVVISFMVDSNLILSLFAIGLPCLRIGSDRIYPNVVRGMRRCLCRLLYPFTQGFVFQTEEARNCFSGRFYERATVIGNPLVADIPKRNAIIANYIVTVGRLSKQKNHQLLIRAFSEFSKEYSDYQLQIHGKGEEHENLEMIIQQLGMQEKVFLLGTSDTVLKEISHAKMFVLTSDYEGMPNVLAEAMAIGLPCVSTDCLGGGAAALINNGVNGLLVPVGDIEKLILAMKQIAKNDMMANKLGEEAKKIVNSLAVSTISDEWLQYIDSILKG